MALDRAGGTVHGAEHGAPGASKFFDNTPCHRITDYPRPEPLFVLQCGDPTGTGQGGPGYTIPDEKPKSLKAAPTTTPVAAGQEAPVVYPAGTLAMANSGQPHTGGSQFFLVYGDSQLPPDYTVFGTASTRPADQVLNDIAAGRASRRAPTRQPASRRPTTASRRLPVTITKAAVAAS